MDVASVAIKVGDYYPHKLMRLGDIGAKPGITIVGHGQPPLRRWLVNVDPIRTMINDTAVRKHNHVTPSKFAKIFHEGGEGARMEIINRMWGAHLEVGDLDNRRFLTANEWERRAIYPPAASGELSPTRAWDIVLSRTRGWQAARDAQQHHAQLQPEDAHFTDQQPEIDLVPPDLQLYVELEDHDIIPIVANVDTPVKEITRLVAQRTGISTEEIRLSWKGRAYATSGTIGTARHSISEGETIEAHYDRWRHGGYAATLGERCQWHSSGFTGKVL